MSVLIVGAGWAGLSCGYQLKNLMSDSVGLQLFEARSKIGGRIQQVPVEEAPWIEGLDMDMGGQDIFLAARKGYRNILNEADRLTYDAEYSTAPWDVSSTSFLYCDAPDSCGEQVSCVNELPFPRTDLGENAFADKSAASFANQFFLPPLEDVVELETEVVQIKYEKQGKIKVKTADDNKYKVDVVVVAVPLSTIKKENITFVPPLPEAYAEVFANMRYRSGVRIWVEFKNRFYDHVTDFDFDIPTRLDYWDAVRGYDTTKNIITVAGSRNGISYGKNLDYDPSLGISDGVWTGLTDEQIKDKVLCDLDAAHNGAATGNFTGNYYVQNWEKEPYIEMAVHLSTKKANVTVFNKPVDGRIWFAGEYTVDFFRQQTNRFRKPNAALSGTRVAAAIFESFKCDGTCVDDDGWVKSGGKEKGCEWVAKKRFKRCSPKMTGTSGEVEKTAEVACPKACKQCLDICPN